MTLDRRDWVEVGCEECGWGIRGREENVTKALTEHRCEKSQEEKNSCWDCGRNDGGETPCCSGCLERSVSPSACPVCKKPDCDPTYVATTHTAGHAGEAVGSSNATEHSNGTQTMEYDSGVRRTPKAGKVNWSLVLDGPLISRLARHLTKGEETHGKRNWMKANSEEDLERFRESAVRHFFQWYYGETNEDHFAATVFNMNGAELCKDRLREELPDPDEVGYS